MDARAALAICALLVVAGCVQAPTASTPGAGGAATPTPPGAATTPTGTPAGSETPEEDRLGWEGGYRYDDELAVNATDGLNASELDAVVSRAMARVERLRGLEFRRSVPVETISRERYRERFADGRVPEARRAFANATYEALFLIGEDEDALEVRRRTTRSVVLGFYSPGSDRIVVVTEGETAAVSEAVLAHELVHALQFDHFDPGSYDRSTTDRDAAVRGLIEGDARLIDQRYGERCAANWSCVSPPRSLGAAGGRDFRFSVYTLIYFPYSDGPVFVERIYGRGGWEAVNAVYRAPPESGEQVIDPARYGTDSPTDVALPDRSGPGWSPVERPGRGPTDTLGQPAVAAMFMHPAFDGRDGVVVSTREFLRTVEGGRLPSVDPFDYGFDYADGWDGDALRVYRNGDGELGYVWRLVWDSPAEAREFAAGYRELLAHWGGERVDGRPGVWRIPEGESGFADAFYVRVDGATVTVVNAPTAEELSAVHGPVPGA